MAGSIVATGFECCPDMSTPRSAITAIAWGLTCEGFVPALWTRTRSPKRARARASAIWLRAELATHRNRTLRKGVVDMGYAAAGK